MRLWDAATGRPLGPARNVGRSTSTAFAHGGGVGASRGKAFSPDATLLLSGRADGTARLWDVATGHPVGPPLWHGSEVQSVVFRPDGRLLATGDATAAHLWDTPQPIAGDPARVLLWAEVMTNQQFDAEGDAIRPMDAPTWDEHRRRLTHPEDGEGGASSDQGNPTFAALLNPRP
jgi:WD40 repeat protein